eukprot:CAMPEP_0201670928 /NCGR_PEP_ID=MMETSP0494-20130426/28141_1 /ASSEMBLY_ACC=CAM_ASM_000839 /TAXON_ID=420259 /ORGANISM="Thalassiosira gravida, Strain GMp14c1" /LENGTH=51 /DNA_ID=CAMNT_0048152119 /DNA_START=65 /DNA_END=217 /DNA_ORIENTATION=-
MTLTTKEEIEKDGTEDVINREGEEMNEEGSEDLTTRREQRDLPPSAPLHLA